MLHGCPPTSPPRAALAAAKARGAKPGSARPGHWNGREAARQAGAKAGAIASATVRAKAAVEAYADLAPAMTTMRADGLSFQAIAGRLNAEGHTTRRGRPWNPMQVARVLKNGVNNDGEPAARQWACKQRLEAILNPYGPPSTVS